MRRNHIDNKLPKGSVKDLHLLKKYLLPYKKDIVGVLIALIISSGAVLSIGGGVKYLVDQGFDAGNTDILDKAIFILSCIIIVLAASTFARFYLITKVGEKAVADIRKEIFNHLIHLSPSFFESNKTGEVMSRITADTTVLQMVIGSSLSIALRNILLLIGGLIMLVVTSPMLAIYIAVMIPLVVVPVLILGKRVRNLSKIAQDKVAELAVHIEESLSGIKTVQSYNRQEIEYGFFSDKAKDALSSAMARVTMRAFLTALVIIISFGSISFVLWLGGHEVIAGNMTSGDLSSFIFYSVIVASAFGAISQVIGDIQRAAGAAQDLMRLIGTKSEIYDPPEPLSLRRRNDNQLGRDVSFKNVTFHYPSRPDTPSIRNLSFDIKSGETIALVGPSGAGKSTILQLLLRFYDPSEGSIKIDGVDICDLALKDLRSEFAYVSQDTMIFSSTVRDNIAYSNSIATEEEIIKAAEIARADGFIRKLPQGFDSYLGEKGVRLSGGERQRIAIARAVLKNPHILLLDEATSALDSENEKLVQEALDNLTNDRTTIIIAHRLSTVLKADKIMVINDGKIENIGTHKQLLRKSKLYKKLAEMQFNS